MYWKILRTNNQKCLTISTENYSIEHQIEKVNQPTSSQSASEQFSITLVWYVTPVGKQAKYKPGFRVVHGNYKIFFFI